METRAWAHDICLGLFGARLSLTVEIPSHRRQNCPRSKKQWRLIVCLGYEDRLPATWFLVRTTVDIILLSLPAYATLKTARKINAMELDDALAHAMALEEALTSLRR